MSVIKTIRSEENIELKLINQLSAAGIAVAKTSFGDVTKLVYTSPATGNVVFVRSTVVGSGDDCQCQTLTYLTADFFLGR